MNTIRLRGFYNRQVVDVAIWPYLTRWTTQEKHPKTLPQISADAHGCITRKTEILLVFLSRAHLRYLRQFLLRPLHPLP